jgi:hypothetical protein
VSVAAQPRGHTVHGVHALALLSIVLAAITVRATEFYTTRYQSLPAMDWVESRPPLSESTNVPASEDLVRGLTGVLPLLAIRDDVHSRPVEFGPPAFVQRTMGGVRDASRIELGSPGAFDLSRLPIDARLDVIVFDRSLRAAAWSDLMAREMDVRDPESGQYQVRASGPDEPDGVWVGRPDQWGGVSTVVGHRGPIGFVFQIVVTRSLATDPGDVATLTDLRARAEAMARQGATDWTGWLVQQAPSIGT